jgi:hypothetical protein
LKDIWKEKRRWKFTKGALLLYDNPPAHRALATQKKLAFLGFQFLDLPLSVSGPVELPPVSWIEKSIERSDAEAMLLQRPVWTDKFLNFLVGLKGWNNGLRSVLSFVWSMLTKSRVWSL